MSEHRVTRRVTLSLLATTPLWVGLLSACGKKTEPDSCNDSNALSKLSDEEKASRTALQYTDKSPEAARVCNVCSYYKAAQDPAQCAGCTLIKGPVHPKGFCSGFAAKAPAPT